MHWVFRRPKRRAGFSDGLAPPLPPRDKRVLGAERERGIHTDDRRLVAYNESGHALMVWLLPEADPLEKVSIIPRGWALGATEQLPSEKGERIRALFEEAQPARRRYSAG